MFRRFLVVAILFASFATPLRAQEAFTRLEPTAKELESCLRTDWYGVYLQNVKVGYFKTWREATDAGIRDSIFMNMKIVAMEQKVEMTLGQSMLFEKQTPHALLKVKFTEQFGPVATEIEWTRTKPGTYEIVQTNGKIVRKKSVDGIDFALGDTLAMELWIKRGPAIGAQIKARDLEVKDHKVEFQASKILGSKNSLVGGVNVKFYQVESVSNHDKITVVTDHDDHGRLILGKIANVFELRAEPEAEAKNTEYSKDLFVMGMAKVDRKLGDLRDVKELVLEVDGPAKVFGDGPRQSLKKDGSKSILSVGKRFGANDKATKDDVAENLKETSAYDLSHPKVKELAAKAVGGAVTPEDKVKNIAKFVHRYVIPEYNGAIPTIHSLIENKVGDCKSYALLFATLARANGVPAREVSGLMYVGDDQKAFGGHAWNEVILNGVWVPIDASLNETEVNATHLCLGTDKMAARNMLESLGGLKLKVVEVKGR